MTRETKNKGMGELTPKTQLMINSTKGAAIGTPVITRILSQNIKLHENNLPAPRPGRY
jgi:hypothetical protein